MKTLITSDASINDSKREWIYYNVPCMKYTDVSK